MYIMYDTKTIIKNSKDCRLNPFGPDFIQEAINLFLDSLNMFSGIYHVRNDWFLLKSLAWLSINDWE